MVNIYIYRVPLPNGVKEMVMPDVDDDGFTMYINEKLSDENALKAYQHALKHIENNDFEKSDVDEIEAQRHNQ